MNEIKVTVLMSVYNGEKYLSQSVESILNQTYENFEFVIIDDGSTDNSYSILKQYASQYSQIVLIKNEKNLGLTKSLNLGLKIAKGKYIGRQDADDVSHPERLEREIEFLEDHLDHAAVGTFVKILDKDGNICPQLVCSRYTPAFSARILCSS